MSRSLLTRMTPAEREHERIATCANVIDVLKSVRLHLPAGVQQLDELSMLTAESSGLVNPPTTIHAMYKGKHSPRQAVLTWLLSRIVGAQESRCVHTVRHASEGVLLEATFGVSGTKLKGGLLELKYKAPSQEALAACKTYAGVIHIVFAEPETEDMSGHAVVGIFHTDRRTVEIVDSNGPGRWYTPGIMDSMRRLLASEPYLADWTIDEQVQLCPRTSELRQRVSFPQDETGGTCSVWAALYMFLRVVCYETDPRDLYKQILACTTLERAALLRNYLAVEWQVYRYYLNKQARPKSLQTISLFGVPFLLSSRKRITPGLRKRGTARGITVVSSKKAVSQRRLPPRNAKAGNVQHKIYLDAQRLGAQRAINQMRDAEAEDDDE